MCCTNKFPWFDKLTITFRPHRFNTTHHKSAYLPSILDLSENRFNHNLPLGIDFFAFCGSEFVFHRLFIVEPFRYGIRQDCLVLQLFALLPIFLCCNVQLYPFFTIRFNIGVTEISGISRRRL